MVKLIALVFVCVLQNLCHAKLDLTDVRKSLDGIFAAWNSIPTNLVEQLEPAINKYAAEYDESDGRLQKEVASNEEVKTLLSAATGSYHLLVERSKAAIFTIGERRKQLLAGNSDIRDAVENSWEAVNSGIEKVVAGKQGDCQTKVQAFLDTSGQQSATKILGCAEKTSDATPLVPAEALKVRDIVRDASKKATQLVQKCSYEANPAECFPSAIKVSEDASAAIDTLTAKYYEGSSQIINFAKADLTKCTKKLVSAFSTTASDAEKTC